MLGVMFIIAILSTMMSSVVSAGRRQARQTDCKSNLRQMGVAILVYRGEHNGGNPPWLSNLYPDYLDDKRVFVCRSDREKGLGAIRPADLPIKADPEKFPEVIDNDSGIHIRHAAQNTAVRANSYFYEFSQEECPWPIPADYDLDKDPSSTKWWEFKEDQLRYGSKEGNGGTHEKPVPYSQSRLPIVRCYHHHREARIPAYVKNDDGTRSSKISMAEHITINVAYAGNVYVGPLWWEGMPEPGEQPVEEPGEPQVPNSQ
jgi:type II secretory pathway pseudopilin PulG